MNLNLEIIVLSVETAEEIKIRELITRRQLSTINNLNQKIKNLSARIEDIRSRIWKLRRSEIRCFSCRSLLIDAHCLKTLSCGHIHCYKCFNQICPICHESTKSITKTFI